MVRLKCIQQDFHKDNIKSYVAQVLILEKKYSKCALYVYMCVYMCICTYACIYVYICIICIDQYVCILQKVGKNCAFIMLYLFAIVEIKKNNNFFAADAYVILII